MQRDRKQVDADADVPVLGGIEVHVAGQWLGVRRGIEGMSEHTAPAVEGIGVAVGAAREADGQGAGRGRIGAGAERHLAVLLPLSKSAFDLGAGGGFVEYGRERRERK